MVGQEEDAVVPASPIHLGAQGTDHPRVEPLDAEQLTVKVAVVRTLVGRFDVDGDKVMHAQHVERCVHLAFVVCVDLSRGTVGADHVKPYEPCDAVAERDRRNDGSVKAVALFEVGKRNGGAFRPEPNAVCGHFALTPKLLAQRVRVEYLVCTAHKLKQGLGVFAAGGQDGTDLFAEVIVRRYELYPLNACARLLRNVPEGVTEVYLHPRLLRQGSKVGMLKQSCDYRI